MNESYADEDDEDDEDYEVDFDKSADKSKTIMQKACEFEYLNFVLNSLNTSNPGYYARLIAGLTENKKNELKFFIENAASRKTVKNK